MHTSSKIALSVVAGFYIGVMASAAVPAVSSPVMPDTLPTRPLDYRHSLGFVLKSYRTAFGLTQTRLGTVTGLKATRISYLERGLGLPQLFESKRLYYAFDSMAQSHLSDSTFTYIKDIYTQLLDSILKGRLGLNE